MGMPFRVVVSQKGLDENKVDNRRVDIEKDVTYSVASLISSFFTLVALSQIL